MNCVEWEEKIAFWAGDDLASGDVAAVEEHIRNCPECARFHRELEADARGLRLPPPEASSFGYSASRQQIRRRATRDQWRGRLVLPAIAAAAAVILAIALRTTVEPMPPPPPILARVPELPHVVPGVKRVGGLRPTRFRPRLPKPDRELEAALQRFTDSQQSPQESRRKTPVEMQIRTKDPNVTILVFQANEATPNENE